jgi:hypothetical protein
MVKLGGSDRLFLGLEFNKIALRHDANSIWYLRRGYLAPCYVLEVSAYLNADINRLGTTYGS